MNVKEMTDFSKRGEEKLLMSEIYTEFHNKSKWPPVIKPNNEKINNKLNKDAVILDYQSISTSLSEALKTRKTTKEITLKSHFNNTDLGTFLKWSAGESQEGSRVYPSAGGLYPINIYIVIQRVKGIDPGLYLYNSKKHSLQWVSHEVKIQKALVQKNINGNICCIIAANFKSSFKNYGERGYRFCLLEAGHIVQNMMLVASTMELSLAPIGGFEDDAANELLKGIVDSPETIYLIPVGEANS